MSEACVVHPCGCRVSQIMGGGGITGVVVCPDHRGFESVRRGFRVLIGGLEDAHEQLPVRTAEPSESRREP